MLIKYQAKEDLIDECKNKAILAKSLDMQRRD